MSLKPICMPCQRFFKPHRNGYWFTEGMPVGPGRSAPGTVEPEKWKPYKIWQGDVYKCEGCAAEIIVGVGFQPLRVRHHEDFEYMRQRTDAIQFQVNDC